MSIKRCYRKALISLSILAAVLVATSSTIRAQQTAARPDRGVGPTGSFALSDIESINLTNGNLNLSIPLASLPPIAGGRLSAGFRAVYDSKLWNVVRHQVWSTEPPVYNYFEDIIQQANEGGWQITGAGFNLYLRDSHEDVDWVFQGANDPDWSVLSVYPNWHKWFLSTPDGAEHELKPLGAIPAGQPPYSMSREYLRGYYKDVPDTLNPPAAMKLYSFDGSFIWARLNSSNDPSGIAWEVYMPDGTRVYQRNNGVQKIQDTNGNKIKMYSTTDANGVVTGHVQDEQTSREIRLEGTPGSVTTRIWYQTVGGSWVNVDVNFGTTYVFGKTFENRVPHSLGGACNLPTSLYPSSIGLDVVREIVLPQTETAVQRKFTFSYNSDGQPVTVDLPWYEFCDYPPAHITQASPGWGQLNQMTLPSGASVNYSYDPVTSEHALGAPDWIARAKITAKTLTHDGASETWTYTNGIQAPDGSVTTEYRYPTDAAFPSTYSDASGLGGLVYKTDYSGKKTVERRWIRKMFNGADDTITSSGVARFNPVVAEEYTTLPGNPSKMSARDFQYDFNGNVTQETDYDWFDPSLATRDGDAANLPTGVPASATVLRVITNSYYNDSTDINSANVYAKRVIGDPPAPLILNAPKETIVGPADTQFSYDGQVYGSAPTVGNLTRVSRLKSGTTFLDTTHTYDAYGNKISATDPNQNKTDFTIDPLTHAQPTEIKVYPDRSNTSIVHTTTIACDYSTGLVISETDPSGNATTTNYDNQLLTTDPMHPVKDPFGRAGLVTDPQGRKVIAIYHDNARYIETKADLKAVDDELLKSKTSSDQLGRAVKVETSEDGSTYTIATDTAYEQMGRIVYSSNPHRSASASTDGWARTTKDEVGRIVEVATFNGATQPTATATSWNGQVQTTYNAEQTTVTDQAGTKRRSLVDGLGRLVRVDEPDSTGNLDDTTVTPAVPLQSTNYFYDALGNLIRVDQGNQHRYFTYDSLSRLKTAKNPEQVSGSTQIATTYDYDDASNLLSKTGPNSGSSASFTYDGLNRVKTKALSSGGAWDYTYDSASISNAKGRLVSVVLHNGTDGCYYDGYDAMGRVTASRQITTAGTANSYTLSYGYDLGGNLTSQTYPSGKEYRTSYDNAGRVSGVTRYISSVLDKTYASGFSYIPHGAASSMMLGNNLIEKTTFNTRLQPTQIRLGTSASPSSVLQLDYTYNTTGQANNNGDMLTQTITAPKIQGGNLVLTQNYSYDALNRLSFAEELIGTTSQWKQTYDIDRWGNRAVRNDTTYTTYIPNPLLTPLSASSTDFSAFNQNTNRIALGGFVYDTSGNLKADPTTGANAMVYDAENRQTSYTKSGATTSYSYDGDGRRVKRTDPDNTTTIFVYNVHGQLIAEYNSGTPSGGGTSYLTSDHLGSTRVVTSAADGVGNVTVKARYDYLPFGEEIGSDRGSRSLVTGYLTSDKTRQKFTQKERDTESGLDYFLARYYSSPQGRFTSVDPLTGEEGVPQSWNRYTYALNNPLNITDPTGEKWAVQYTDGNAAFRWYDGDTIPGDWQGKWEEYTAGWYIGSDSAIRLGTRGATDVLVLTKDLFSNEDWGKLEGADAASLSREQKEILFSGATYRGDQIETTKRMAFVAEIGAYLISGVRSARGTQQGLGPKSTVPQTPGGMTLAKFGQQVMKWGRSGAEARARITTITREELESSGVTKQLAKAWRNFYQQEAIRNPGNPSAAGRAELMDHAVKLLKGK